MPRYWPFIHIYKDGTGHRRSYAISHAPTRHVTSNTGLRIYVEGTPVSFTLKLGTTMGRIFGPDSKKTLSVDCTSLVRSVLPQILKY